MTKTVTTGRKAAARVGGRAAPPATATSDPLPSLERVTAELVAVGPLASAVTLSMFVNSSMSMNSKPMVTRNDCMGVLVDAGLRARSGDLRDVEGMLAVQAITLNGVFNALAQRAASNIGASLSTVEAYLRLALKAQNQSRMTLETLATIKNPPTVFAKQANIAHQQQVNNGTQATGGGSPAPAPARENQPEQSKLLEASHGERLDFGAQGAAGGTHQELAPVGAINRADERRR